MIILPLWGCHCGAVFNSTHLYLRLQGEHLDHGLRCLSCSQ